MLVRKNRDSLLFACENIRLYIILSYPYGIFFFLSSMKGSFLLQWYCTYLVPPWWKAMFVLHCNVWYYIVISPFTSSVFVLLYVWLPRNSYVIYICSFLLIRLLLYAPWPPCGLVVWSVLCKPCHSMDRKSCTIYTPIFRVLFFVLKRL